MAPSAGGFTASPRPCSATTTGKRVSGGAHAGTTTTARPGPHGCGPMSHSRTLTLGDDGNGSPPPAAGSLREHASAVAAPSSSARRPRGTGTSVGAWRRRLPCGRAYEIDQRRIGRETVAKSIADRVELRPGKRGEMRGRLVDLLVEIRGHVDLAGPHLLECRNRTLNRLRHRRIGGPRHLEPTPRRIGASPTPHFLRGKPRRSPSDALDCHTDCPDPAF